MRLNTCIINVRIDILPVLSGPGAAPDPVVGDGDTGMCKDDTGRIVLPEKKSKRLRHESVYTTQHYMY